MKMRERMVKLTVRETLPGDQFYRGRSSGREMIETSVLQIWSGKIIEFSCQWPSLKIQWNFLWKEFLLFLLKIQDLKKKYDSFWVSLDFFHREADEYRTLFWGYLPYLYKPCSFDVGHFYTEKMQFNLKKNLVSSRFWVAWRFWFESVEIEYLSIFNFLHCFMSRTLSEFGQY